MTSAFENLAGPGKALRLEPPDANEFDGLHRMGLEPCQRRAARHSASEVWRILAKCHDTRNLGEYEGMLDVNERLVKDLIAACQKVAMKVGALSRPQA